MRGRRRALRIRQPRRRRLVRGAVRAVPISGEDKSRRVLGTMVDGWTGSAVQASASREKLCTNRNARLTAKKPFPV
jgi:hypothetical protein